MRLAGFCLPWISSGIWVWRSRWEVRRTWDASFISPGKIADYDMMTKNNNGQKMLKIASSQQQLRLQMGFFPHIFYVQVWDRGKWEFLNQRQIVTQQDTRHNKANCDTYVSHFTVVEGEGRQRLVSGHRQDRDTQYSAFSTGNQISFPLLSCSDLYMEIAWLLQSQHHDHHTEQNANV